MPVDYDLVIIGGTTAGVEAAIFAAQFRARVALVTQGIVDSSLTDSWVGSALAKFGKTALHGRSPFWSATQPTSLDWATVQSSLEAIAINLDHRNSLSALATLGIDVISDRGEFCRKPAPGFLVSRRLLRSRAYLLAPAPRPLLPAIPNLQAIGYQTSETLLQLPSLPASMVIVGTTTMAVELAQALQRLGCQITLMMTTAQLLPNADREVCQWIQAQLEAEGVEIWLNASIHEIQCIDGKKSVQFGTRSLVADEILIAANLVPDVETLNLDAIAVQRRNHKILRSSTLQTTNPHVYICEGRTKQAVSSHLAVYEAKLAVRNALFFAKHHTHYRAIPFSTQTSPPAAWIGLTESQAVQQYGQDILILRQPFQGLTKAQIHSDLTGFCKLIVLRDGTLLGAQTVGTNAEEFIGTIAIAFQQGLKIQALADLVVPSPSFAEIIQPTAAQWQRLRLKHHPRWQDFLEAFFDIRRSWSK
jgi:pyruvate/2-oxoglutarate dehydrogenase complex dihydrolipoamide dehydrogenase (E3) component